MVYRDTRIVSFYIAIYQYTGNIAHPTKNHIIFYSFTHYTREMYADPQSGSLLWSKISYNLCFDVIMACMQRWIRKLNVLIYASHVDYCVQRN